MSGWSPKPRAGMDIRALNLSGEEGFVLSRLDGSTTVRDVVLLTGLPEARVHLILERLVSEGVVSAPLAAEGAPSSSPTKGAPAVAAEVSAEAHAVHGPGNEAMDAAMDAAEAAATDDAVDDAIDLDGAEDPAAHGADTDEHRANHRKLFHDELADLAPALREAMAQAAEEPELSALCFDPLPSVIKGIFENAHAGPAHARLVARHHQTSQGLDALMARAELMRDAQTQRLLLQNPMLQEPQLKRLLQPRRLAEVYRATISREIPERNRQKARLVLRSKWSLSDGEERAALVFQSEGRCLAQLTGMPFDARTISTLCSKAYTSTLLIQNLARFGATPPPVLAHLLKQGIVRRQLNLKTLIFQHPNCPADAKRKG